LIFDRHFEIAFLQIFRTDLSHSKTFLCSFGIGLPLQHLHIPTKCCRHLATPTQCLVPTDNGVEKADPVASVSFAAVPLAPAPQQQLGTLLPCPSCEPYTPWQVCGGASLW